MALTWVVMGAVATLGGAWLWGGRLPRAVEVGRTLDVPQRPEVVWNVVTDWHGQPSWRRGLRGIVGSPRPEPGASWREDLHGGTSIAYRVTTWAPHRELVLRIGDEGTDVLVERTVTLAPLEGGGTRVTVRETSDAASPFERLRAHYLSPERFVEKYLLALAKRLGAEPKLTQLR